MSLLSFFSGLFRKFTANRSPTENLTNLYVRVRQQLPDLDEDTAFILAAKLDLQPYLTGSKLDLLDVIAAYKVGKEGFCGLWLPSMQRHDAELAQDEASKITRWSMQMEFLHLNADLKSASPEVLADIVIQRKNAIQKTVEAVLTAPRPADQAGRKYDLQIQRVKNSPDYEDEIDKIRYALRQV